MHGPLIIFVIQNLMLTGDMNAETWCLLTIRERAGRGQSTGISLSLQVQGGKSVSPRQLRMPSSEYLVCNVCCG